MRRGCAPLSGLLRQDIFRLPLFHMAPRSTGKAASSCFQPWSSATSQPSSLYSSAPYAPAWITRRAYDSGIGWIRAVDVGGSRRASAMKAARAQEAAVHAAMAWVTLAHAVRHRPKAAANDSTIHSRVQLRGIRCGESKPQLHSYAPHYKCRRHLLFCECRDHCMAESRRDRLCIRRCRCNHTTCRP